MDFVQATQGQELMPLGGEQFPVRILNFGEWAPFQAWLKKQWPSPLVRAAEALDQIRAEGREVSYDAEDMLLSHAQEQALHWPPRVGSPQWVGLIDETPDAAAELLFTILPKTIPGFDRAAAEQLAKKATAAEIVALFRWAFLGVRPGPKSEGAPTAPAPSPSGPSGG